MTAKDTPAALGVAVRSALDAAGLPDADPVFERPRNRDHGDWSTNVALALAKPAGRAPREVAQVIVEHLSAPEQVAAVTIAGPGFINFTLAHDALQEVVRDAVLRGPAWGRSPPPDPDRVRRVQVEFVSTNPTGPLHVGHGRWVAAGDAIAALLEATGWEVQREYYLNDAGNQLDLFGASIAAHMEDREPPENGYRGEYVAVLAAELRAAGVPASDAAESGYQRMLLRIKETMRRARVHIDVWFSERDLHSTGAVTKAVERLRAQGHVYEQDGAVWLRTTTFGDDKDRVLLRADGRPTYFAADAAYLASKVDRGFDKAIYLLGADHHGYVKRLLAIGRAMGLADGHVEVLIGQLVNLLRDGVPARMSKRSGDLVEFDELIDEVGIDAARYTFLRTSLHVSLDFEINQVVRQDRDNPVYYVQYSHARIAGIMRTAAAQDVHGGEVEDAPLDLLTHPSELELIRRIATYPELLRHAAEERAPHKVARHAEELAEAFHVFYRDCQVVGDDEALTRARYWLCVATRQTLVNALGVLGVSAPDRM